MPHLHRRLIVTALSDRVERFLANSLCGVAGDRAAYHKAAPREPRPTLPFCGPFQGEEIAAALTLWPERIRSLGAVNRLTGGSNEAAGAHRPDRGRPLGSVRRRGGAGGIFRLQPRPLAPRLLL